jgi:hypothetical protein
MAVDVTIRFVPPDDPDVGALRVYEAPAVSGPFVQIDRTVDVGAYPDYIDYFITHNAADKGDWFAIAWEDTSGAEGVLSVAVRGGTETLVGMVLDRVRQRDRTLDENLVRQEAEGAIEFFFNSDPYNIELANLPSNSMYRTLNGLAYLTMARAYLFLSAGSKEVQSATLALVSFRSESGSQRSVDVQELIDLANVALGISTSIILQLDDIFDQDSPDYFFKNVNPVNILEL